MSLSNMNVNVAHSQGRLRYSVQYWTMILLIVLPLFFVPIKISLTAENIQILFTFSLVGICVASALYSALSQSPFSINCAHWIFLFFFFFWMPTIQFLRNSFPSQADAGAVPHYLLATNALILIWCVFYWFTYQIAFFKGYRQKIERAEEEARLTANSRLLLILSVVCSLVMLRFLGIDGMINRGEAEGAFNANATVFAPLEVLCRSIPIAVFTFLFIARRYKLTGNKPVFLSFLLMFFCNFPTSLGRFWLGALAIGLICLFIRERKISGLWLMLTFCLGFGLFMPALAFLRATSNPLDLVGYEQRGLFDVATTGDFDAYEMFANTLQHCQIYGMMMGHQLLGALLFFVPRSLWPDKAVPSGAFIADHTHLGLTFDNLSEPLPAEGYIDFGIIGLVAFASILAITLAWADRVYWNPRSASPGKLPSTLSLAYPYLIGFIISLMRGALLPVYADMFGFVVACWIVAHAGVMRIRQTIPVSASAQS